MNRLLTKADRERSREAQFNYLTKGGYQKTEYKNLIIFYHPTELLLKTFWGTAANHTDFYKYRTAEQLAAKIESLKQTADSREKWKAEQKEKNKDYKSSHAATSAAIKAELNKEFAGVKFSVKSDSFAGGNSVDISWTDGPTTEQVEKFSGKYQYGSFNGMEDIYENTNSREDIPQAKYVQEHRTISDEIIKTIAAELIKLKNYTEEEINSYRDNPEQEARRILYKTNIPLSYKSVSLVVDNEWTEFFKVIFDTNEEVKKDNKEAAPVGKIQIVDYSEKAFAVIGEFSPYYDDLLNLGGKYNKFLKCGRGIIFSKTKMEAVKEYLIKAKETNQQPKPEPTEDKETTLRDEIIKTVEFFAEYDKKTTGEISESTKEIAQIQRVNLSSIDEQTPQNYSNLNDLQEAAKSGKVVSLYNMCQLINQK